VRKEVITFSIPSPDKNRDKLREESLFDLNPGKERFPGAQSASK
jgi:hypothetical protein